MNYLIQAIADGIKDAGCTHYANYPGFHANELHAALNAPYTSCDEKNAFAFAWGCSMAGERAVVSFKNVGLNDAADAFLGAHFVGCRAGLVLVLFDDCDIQHSQSRIDVRPYFLICGGLWLEPRSVPEAYDFAKKAFAYSEKFQIPVVLRVTNILYDMGLMPAAWERSQEPVVKFDSLQRYPNRSPYVVHPSEAWRMEQELEEKNRNIREFVETLYLDQPEECSPQIICGAKRNAMAKAPFRIFTLPVPALALKKRFGNCPLSNLTVYEHGGIPFMGSQISEALRGPGCLSRMMTPPKGVRSKYHNNDFMEALFSVLRGTPESIVCGDLGTFTMDPGRTLQLCLCYGISPAVAMGVAEASHGGNRVFCVTGDAAYLHSGQQCLYEMVERQVSVTVFVLENGGAAGTGGQHIPGDLKRAPSVIRQWELDYPSCTEESLARFVDDLPKQGINLVVVHTPQN